MTKDTDKIPKTIHYCWFGGNPLPELAKKCIASWRKYFPDYEIKEWNEKNFDVNIIQYTSEAYTAKKYAFVSDYARFYILYKYGGIYFDTDVEVLKDMSSIIAHGPFMGCENESKRQNNPLSLGVNSGLGLSATAGMQILKEIIDYYNGIRFIKDNREIDSDTVVSKITRILVKRGLKDTDEIQSVAGLKIYPKVYFCPNDKERATGQYNPLTFTAHHYNASWRDQKFNKRIKNPMWRPLFDFSAWFGQTMRKMIGENKWIRIRDKYLTKIHNFVRGTK